MSQSIEIKIKKTLSGFDLTLDLELSSRAVTAVFGPSGSGKTSLLRCVAGLDKAESGDVYFEGECWQGENVFVPVHKRPIAYVFQEASVFPNITVRENLEFSYKRRVNNTYSYELDAINDLCQIHHLVDRDAGDLSGGERQRVALAQALLRSPKLLLLDEPLAALDLNAKNALLKLLENVKQEVNIPILYVTHSILEVSRIADDVVLLNQGKVTRKGKVKDVAQQDWYSDFGEEPGVVLETLVREKSPEWQMVSASLGQQCLWLQDSDFFVGDVVRVFVAAKDVSLSKSHHEDTSILNILSGEVMSFSDGGGMSVLVQLKVDGKCVLAKITKRSLDRLGLVEGDTVWLQVKAVSVMF